MSPKIRRPKYSLQKALFWLFWPGVFLFLLAYSGHQIFTGERRIGVWLSLSEQIQTLNHQNSALQEQIARMEGKVLRLGEGVDEDYLDELVRRNTSMGYSNEKIVFLGD